MFSKKRCSPLHNHSYITVTVTNVSKLNIDMSDPLQCILQFCQLSRDSGAPEPLVPTLQCRTQSKVRHCISRHSSWASLNLEHFPNLPLSFMIVILLKDTLLPPPALWIEHLPDVSSWPDPGCMFRPRTPHRWCCVPLRISHLEAHAACLPLHGDVNFYHGQKYGPISLLHNHPFITNEQSVGEL